MLIYLMEKKVLQIGRVQSPSSIKTYKQCPRKYYYNYIMELPTKSNVHQVRGNIAHSALEHFFDIDTTTIEMENCETQLKLIIQKMLLKEWQNYSEKIEELDLTQEQKIHYFEETMMMLFNWLDLFLIKLGKEKGTFDERFEKLTPIREQLFLSEEYHVRGFIDTIEKDECGVKLMDYKTSKRAEINDHILQLAIYSLLYNEKHGKLPEQVGVYFLKNGTQVEHLMDVDEELVEMAKKEILHVHENTCTDDINCYPKKPGPLCKWSTGQCDFYDVCRPHN